MQDLHINRTANISAANATAPGFPEYLHQPLGATVFQVTLWSTVAFLGVIGNLLVCIVILSQAKMKTSINYYLLSLAIADLGVLLLIYPMAVLKYLFPFRWLLGKQVCFYLTPTMEIFFGASTWSIAAIAIERYRNVVGAKRYQIRYRSRDRIRTFTVIGMVWLASFLVSSVPLYPIMTYNSNRKLCYPKWPDMSGTNAFYLTHSLILLVFWYVLPLIIIVFTYIKIKKRVSESVKFRSSMTSQSLQISERREKSIWRQSNKAKRILTPLVVLYAVTMFPLNALRVLLLIIPTLWTNSYYNLILGQVGFFVLINSSANPLVYYIMSKEFKGAFKKIFKSLKDKRFFRVFCRKIRALLVNSKVLKEEEQNLQLTSNNNSQVALLNVQIVTGL